MRCDCAKTCPKHKAYQRKTEFGRENENVKRQRKKGLKKKYIGLFNFYNVHYVTSSIVSPTFTYKTKQHGNLI